MKVLLWGGVRTCSYQKLRKKLEVDPDVKIVVIRGKGYKLEISS
jgi:DNA-binding response OmpR family regulator